MEIEDNYYEYYTCPLNYLQNLTILLILLIASEFCCQ